MRYPLVVLFILFSNYSFSQFTYNGSFSVGVNTGIATYNYSMVDGKEVKNGQFDFFDSKDYYKVSGKYQNDNEIGTWITERKSLTYNDFPIKKEELIMSRVTKNTPLIETVTKIITNYITSNKYEETITRTIICSWGYPVAGVSKQIKVVKNVYINDQLEKLDANYSFDNVLKTTIKGEYDSIGVGKGNWEIMDRPGYKDIFTFENGTITKRIRIDNKTKLKVEEFDLQPNKNLLKNDNSVTKKYFIIYPDGQDAEIQVKSLSSDISTFKTIISELKTANFSTIDIDYINRIFGGLIPEGLVYENIKKNIDGFPNFKLYFKKIADERDFYIRYSKSSYIETNEKLNTIFQDLNVKENLYQKRNYDYNSPKTMELLPKLIKNDMHFFLWNQKKGKYLSYEESEKPNLSNAFYCFNLAMCDDSSTNVLLSSLIKKWIRSGYEIEENNDILWTETLMNVSKSFYDIDSIYYGIGFLKIDSIINFYENKIKAINKKETKEILTQKLVEIGNQKFLARDLNIIPDGIFPHIIILNNQKTNLENMLDDDSLNWVKYSILYSPSVNMDNFCPKGFKITDLQSWDNLLSSIDNNYKILSDENSLNFKANFQYFDSSPQSYTRGLKKYPNDKDGPFYLSFNKEKDAYFIKSFQTTFQFYITDPSYKYFAPCRCVKE